MTLIGIPIPDLPQTADDQPPVTEIPLVRIGSYKHPRWGDLKITARVLASFVRNFGRPLPVDLDHGPERGGSSEAAGWITGIRVAGRELRARVEWTPLGTTAIREKRYQYISPSWRVKAEDDGELVGAGLTNRPFVTELPALTADGDGLDLDMFAEEEQRESGAAPSRSAWTPTRPPSRPRRRPRPSRSSSTRSASG
jgi:hypothetical protein